jgi:hypothetical protein
VTTRWLSASMSLAHAVSGVAAFHIAYECEAVGAVTALIAGLALCRMNEFARKRNAGSSAVEPNR